MSHVSQSWLVKYRPPARKVLVPPSEQIFGRSNKAVTATVVWKGVNAVLYVPLRFNIIECLIGSLRISKDN